MLALILDPLRLRLQEFVDATFFRGQRVYAERIQKFSRDLTTALDLETIARVLREQINSTVAPDEIHLYSYDLVSDQFIAQAGDDGRPTSDIRFGVNSPLSRYFSKERLPLYLDGTSIPAELEVERSRLNLLGGHLFFALPGENIPTGWLTLGQRRSGQPYTPQDLTFLENRATRPRWALSVSKPCLTWNAGCRK